jgi:predicted ABC-type ATPase
MRGQPAPRVVIFAGPNGAGKTTHAELMLEALGIQTFVNADFIARGLSGRNTEAVNFEAGRIMLRRLQQLAAERTDFAFESTLSSRSFAPFLRELREQGYRVAIHYFSLRSASLAAARVKLRVKLGGHNVPVETVKRRYGRSLANFFSLYQALADEWTLFDNSTGSAELIASHNDQHTTVEDQRAWQKIQRHVAAHLNSPS